MDVLEVVVSKNKEKLDFNLIYNFIVKSYWGKGRTQQQILKSIDNSICYGVYEDNLQVGFARVITDTVTFAYMADVFVIESKRGLGYSRKLIEYILSDQSLLSVKNWYLITKDAQGLYEKFGFINYNDTEKSVMFIPSNQSV